VPIKSSASGRATAHANRKLSFVREEVAGPEHSGVRRKKDGMESRLSKGGSAQAFRIWHGGNKKVQIMKSGGRSDGMGKRGKQATENRKKNLEESF